ncbi:CDP-alcohol phosphatidyltransferase family protein [Oleisolibacter albus]|uniref:CDP-alcohol phosphatidyltransferase family protein n=1 Tax=Oleisolibacter albus TaxID=2171757 RepID=UPI000DF43458|nr:CDP-alcohol phosphatidyltransferase family protein [Oleisolibacter albus]
MGAILGDNPVRLWGMTSAERLRRSLVRNGVRQVRAWDGLDHGSAQVLLRSDFVFDEVLVRDLIKAPGTVLTDPRSGEPVAAHVAASDVAAAAAMLTSSRIVPADLKNRLRVVGPADLSSAYNNALRKKEPPFLLRLTAEALPRIEQRMFGGSYKGVTDLVTKYVWPLPARHVTKLCAVLGISPNMVTTLSAVLVALAFWLFWQGQFLPGLACAWGMTFLDTVDGKLARVTLTSSKWGNVFDHGIDLVHPPFWYWAWMAGLVAVGLPLAQEGLILAIVVGGYVAQRLQEGAFIALFKIEIHIWRRFDSLFRLITARRNPNLLLLTVFALAGQPDTGMVAVAVWTLLSFLVHMVQIVQAFGASRRGPIRSWLAS